MGLDVYAVPHPWHHSAPANAGGRGISRCTDWRLRNTRPISVLQRFFQSPDASSVQRTPLKSVRAIFPVHMHHIHKPQCALVHLTPPCSGRCGKVFLLNGPAENASEHKTFTGRSKTAQLQILVFFPWVIDTYGTLGRAGCVPISNLAVLLVKRLFRCSY